MGNKLPAAPLFSLPHESLLARMLREDLTAARDAWLDDAKGNAEEQTRRVQHDFLAASNHEGHHLDFHSLRHTCGAWLAQSGAHPKTVQAVMRHSSITLTMDTYGHLLPGAEAADQLGAKVSLMRDDDAEDNIVHMTGTDGPEQQLGRGSTLASNGVRRGSARWRKKKVAQVLSGCGLERQRARRYDASRK